MKQLIFPMDEKYEEYVIDESKYTGNAESISFPENEEEIICVLKELGEKKIPVTVQGGKTGITGGAVPRGGHIMNLSHMNHVKDSLLLDDGTGLITVEPGINLIDLKNEIASLFRKTPLFWPPDPTETSASVGGVAACSAQGICRLLYGPSGKYIESLKIIDYSGKATRIGKDESLVLKDGREIKMLDAVIGREGITGIISELTLKLIPKPESVWGIVFFFRSDEDAGRFIDMQKKDMPENEGAKIAAAEYIDRASINLIESRKASMTKIKELPDVEEDISGMVYIEIHGAEESIEELAEELMEAAMVCDSDPDEAWAVSGEADIEKMRAFRHGAAETANLAIENARKYDSRITKLGSDMKVGNRSFSEVLYYLRESLDESGLHGCIFGHALENHLHVNILPDSYEEYERGVLLMRKWAACVEEQKGKVVGEHGIGKLKQAILEDFIPENYMELCKELKTKFDEEYLLNRANILKKAGGQ